MDKLIIGRFAERRQEFTRTLPNHAKNLPWKHELDAVNKLRQDAKHFAVLGTLVAACLGVWFVLPWGGA
jgi:hypothetical protein